MAQWPDSLPVPVIDNFGFTHISPLQATTMTSGRVKVRRRFGATPSQASCQLRYLTKRQAELFEGFIEYECNGGATAFRGPFETPRSEGIEYMDCVLPNYYTGPTIDGVSGLYSFTFTALVMKAPIPSKDQYGEALVGMPLDEALELMKHIHPPWLPTWPQEST